MPAKSVISIMPMADVLSQKPSKFIIGMYFAVTVVQRCIKIEESWWPSMTRQELKIVSGGQTGVDQGALGAALSLGLAWGGWVPKGWRAENGAVPECFRAQMQEHASANYIVRTRDFCMNMMKSHFVVSFGEADAVGKVRKWLGQFFATAHPVPFVLNVAGPRESKSPGIQSRTRLFLTEVLGGMLEG